MSEARKKVVQDCAGDVRAALLTLAASAELMAVETNIGQDVFECGKAAGYLDAARALVDVAERSLYRIIDHQTRPAAPTVTKN